MIIKKIKLKNIRSYENQEIEFPEGSTLLSGDIGSGKTTILLAIEFALFGLQPGQRGSSLLRNGQVQGEVSIEFEIGNKKILIERTLKKAKTISQDYCAITINDEKKEISVTELKNKVLELLNYPKEFSRKQNLLYKFTAYTPQEEMKQIILQDSDTRLNTLRHVFGIDKYKKILENASILILKIREQKKVKQGFTLNLEQDKNSIIFKEEELKLNKTNLDLVEKELVLKVKDRKKIQNEKQEILKKIEEKIKLQQELEKTNLMISNKKDSVDNNSKLIEKLKNQIQELKKIDFDESKISLFEQEIISMKKEKDKLNEKNIEISSQISSFKLKNEENKKLEQKISNLEICPTCLQDIDAVYRANVLNKSHSETFQNNEKIKVFEESKKNILEKIKVFEEKIKVFEEKITDLKILKMRLQEVYEKDKRLNEILKSNVLFEKDIELLNQHRKILEQSVFELKKFDNIFEVKQNELEEALKQERIADIKVAELKKIIELFSNQINELKEKMKETEKVKEQLDYLSNLENWLSKKFVPVISFVEKNVMLKLKREFSNLFSKWFNMLVLDSFNVQLGDDFSPIIEYQDYEIDYAYLSGGERTAIALAYRLALNQVINSLLSKIKTKDFIILDEPTDGFSEQQLDKMRDVLQELNAKQLIIVSHEQKIESFVENMIRFKKEGGISKRA